MKLATRYLLKRLLLPFLLGLFVFTGILLLMELFRLTDLIVNKGIPVRAVVILLLTKIPATLSITVPMSLIMSVIMTFSRMTQDNELISLRMAGYPLHKLLVPPLLLGLIFALTLIGMDQYLLPELSRYKQRTLSKIESINPVGLMKPRTYLTIPPYTLYAGQVNGRHMKNLWIEDRSTPNPRIIVSEEGTWVRRKNGKFSLRLSNGTLHQKGDEGNYRILEFERQTLNFDPNVDSKELNTGGEMKPLTDRYKRYAKLGRKLELAQEKRENIKTLRNEYREVASNFHRSLALPFATFFLVLVTAPTGMLTQKYGTVIDLVFCLGIFFTYYILLFLLDSLAKSGYLNPALALWSPNLFFGCVGIILFFYIRKYGV